MPKSRRDFLKMSGIAYLGIQQNQTFAESYPMNATPATDPINKSLIGPYGDWVNRNNENRLPSLSFRNKKYTDIKNWQKQAQKQVLTQMGYQPIPGMPEVKVLEKIVYDGLHIEKLSYQLPYGRATEAILLKPLNAKGKLPGVLALHDHGGNKYFGHQKITKTADSQHTMMVDHQSEYYGGKAWANELAKKGYLVLVPDNFTFGSRRVFIEDVLDHQKGKLTDQNPDLQHHIDAYNNWASQHEHIMAKSLFSAGTTWPAMFLAEDIKALDILCQRDDVDPCNIGCCGLSGGGLRSCYLGGLDHRIKCAVPVGFMTTWQDLSMAKCYTHTWMTYIPLLPNALDFPEILGIRAPLPTLVLNNNQDKLFTFEAMQKSNKILAEIYYKAKASDQYRTSFYDGPHKFDLAMQKEAFGWFDQWLKR